MLSEFSKDSGRVFLFVLFCLCSTQLNIRCKLLIKNKKLRMCCFKLLDVAFILQINVKF